MQIVTLTADWGLSDFFAGMVKGRLYSLIPDLQVVDIALDVEHYNKPQAAFIVKNACMEFPKGTIHIIDVDSHETKDHPHIAVKYEDQYFICADNGILSAVFYGLEAEIYQISLFQDSNFYTFPAYNLYCFAAEHIATGKSLEDIGYRRNGFSPYTRWENLTSEDKIEILISYVDAYGNAYLNMKYDEFEEMRKGRNFSVYFEGLRTKRQMRISLSYYDSVDSGEHGLSLTVSATGYLEIAQLKSSVSDGQGLKPPKRVTFFFE